MSVSLSDVADGSRVRLETLPNHPALRSRLVAMGIRPGVELELRRRGQPGGIRQCPFAWCKTFGPNALIRG